METALERFSATQGHEVSDRTFGAVVREAALSSWGSRLRWVWLFLIIAAVGYAAFTPVLGFNSPGFPVYCALACWIPAWLGADLLAIRFRENPEPLRAWAPWEFLARAVGRLAPFLMAQTVWLAIFLARSLGERMAQGTAPQMIDPLNGVTSGNLLGYCVAWIAVFHASGLPYFAAAALMSATARRPRPLVVTPIVTLTVAVVLLFGTQAATSGYSPLPFSSPSLDMGSFLSQWASAAANLWIGLTSAELVLQIIQRVLGTRPDPGFDGLCWTAAMMFALYSLPPLALTWWVAVRRWRRVG